MITTTSRKSGWLGRVSHLALAAAGFATALIAAPDAAHAENLIEQPGAHNEYKFELEPHLSIYWGGWGNDTFFGPGIRAAIPLMHNGPIDSINNNIAISFGGDFYFPDNNWYGNGVLLSFPVAGQWNFYFTDIISVFGEVGLVNNIWTGAGDSFDIDPMFIGGGRFQFGKVGVIARVGWPFTTVGANFQF